MNESFRFFFPALQWMCHHTYECVITHMNEWFRFFFFCVAMNVASHIWMCHHTFECVITHMNAQFLFFPALQWMCHHTYEWVMSFFFSPALQWMCHHTYECVITHMNESFRFFSFLRCNEWVMSCNECVITHMNESFHTWIKSRLLLPGRALAQWICHHTYKCAITHIYGQWMCHHTYIWQLIATQHSLQLELTHSLQSMCHHTYEWVISHMTHSFIAPQVNTFIVMCQLELTHSLQLELHIHGWHIHCNSICNECVITHVYGNSLQLNIHCNSSWHIHCNSSWHFHDWRIHCNSSCNECVITCIWQLIATQHSLQLELPHSLQLETHSLQRREEKNEMTHSYVWWHIHCNSSCNECVITRMNASFHIWIKRRLLLGGRAWATVLKCHTFEWIMTHVWISHVEHTNQFIRASWLIHILRHPRWSSIGPYVDLDESCHTDTSHIYTHSSILYHGAP